MTYTLRVARAEATDDNLKTILRLIGDAREWLADKGTNQWWKPWPDREKRDARVWRGLEVGATWIVWAEERAVATVTVAKSPNPDVWRDAACIVDDPAIYVELARQGRFPVTVISVGAKYGVTRSAILEALGLDPATASDQLRGQRSDDRQR